MYSQKIRREDKYKTVDICYLPTDSEASNDTTTINPRNRRSNANRPAFVDMVMEDKGEEGLYRHNRFRDYDPDPNERDFLKASGARLSAKLCG